MQAEGVALTQSAFSSLSIELGGCAGRSLGIKEIMIIIIIIMRLMCLREIRISEESNLGEGAEGLGEGRDEHTQNMKRLIYRVPFVPKTFYSFFFFATANLICKT